MRLYNIMNGISTSIRRLDAVDKTAGFTEYIADMDFGDCLNAKIFRSTKARGEILSVKKPSLPDGYYIIDKDDVPGENAIYMINADWPVFADQHVRFIGQRMSL